MDIFENNFDTKIKEATTTINMNKTSRKSKKNIDIAQDDDLNFMVHKIVNLP